MNTRLSSFILAGLLQLPFAASAERLVLVAGGGTNEPNGVPAKQVQLKEPFGVAFDAQGAMFIIEMAKGNRLLKVDAQGRTTHISGTGTAGFAGDGGPVRTAQFNGPHNLAITPQGEILIADTWNGRVRKLDLKVDKASTLPGFSVPAGKERGSGPYCISLNPAGDKLYIADLRRIHEITFSKANPPQGFITKNGAILEFGETSITRWQVVAGNGQKGVPPDGAKAAEAPLVDPRAVAVDRQGNVYILERGGNALRVVDKGGRIRTVVNASGKKGWSGDGGPALAATMNGPKHLCIDPQNNVIIADAENHVIRRYKPKDGTIHLVAGTGVKGGAGVGGPPDKVQLARPHGVTYGSDGFLYITDSYNDRILRCEP